eukprot:jgi/Astpho2/2110/fgenesh1_pg.00038_%23_168_t
MTSEGPAEVETVKFRLGYGKSVYDLELPVRTTVGQIKAEAYKLIQIPPEMQKLLIGGKIKPDDATLTAAGVKKGMKLMLIGSKMADAPPVETAPWLLQVLDKGKPEGTMPGIAGRQVSLQEHENVISGLLNSRGEKARMTFKPETEELWIGSPTTTQKLQYRQISKIDSHAIPDNEAYSMIALHLGSEGRSKLWLYWVPSQYVASIKHHAWDESWFRQMHKGGDAYTPHGLQEDHQVSDLWC